MAVDCIHLWVFRQLIGHLFTDRSPGASQFKTAWAEVARMIGASLLVTAPSASCEVPRENVYKAS